MPWIAAAGGHGRVLKSLVPMTTQFKRIPEKTVMCTVQGCSEVAAFFFAGMGPGPGAQSIAAAYCEEHAEDAARRLGHPWPIAERKPPEKIERNARYSTGGI